MVACDSNQERAKKTIEERLSDSFAMSNRDLRTRVDTIVMASKDKDNIEAMNELGILSRTNNNNEQKRAIELLMTELRNAMETEELARKNKLQDQ
jgi:hypothetical protein